MRKRISVLGAVATLMLGMTLFIAPSIGHAGTITSIDVTASDGTHFLGCVGPFGTCGPRQIWSFAIPIVLPVNGTLVLAQNQRQQAGALGYDFDPSDHGAGPVTIVINGLPTILSDSTVLNFHGADVQNQANEAHLYTVLGTIPNPPDPFLVEVGYADSLHENACVNGAGPDASHLCFPNATFPFDNVGTGGATVFIGHGAGDPGVGFTAGHCVFATSTCWDSGVIRITELPKAVPEPSTLFLLGAGLMVLGSYARKFLKRNS